MKVPASICAIKNESSKEWLSSIKTKTHYIYKITNKINGKIYIGQTCNPKQRWRSHRKTGLNPKYPLQKAIKKYGVLNFIFELEPNELFFNQSEANLAEERLIKKYNSTNINIGYNIKSGGNVSSPSIITIEKTRRTMLNKNIKLSDEAKQKLSNERQGANNPMFGKCHFNEHKNKIAESMRGDKNHFYGKCHSEETKTKMSKCKKGKKLSESVIKQMSERVKGSTWKIVNGKRVYSFVNKGEI